MLRERELCVLRIRSKYPRQSNGQNQSPLHLTNDMAAMVELQSIRRLETWQAAVHAYKGVAKQAALLALAVLATAQFIGAYLFLEFPYVDLYRFERGYERLPFQTRLLLAPLYRWANQSPFMVSYARQLARNTYFFPRGIYAEDVIQFYLDIACVLFAGWVATRLYRAASSRHLLQPLVFPLFLALCVAVYILHTVQNFRYVYDMPSLAFFAAGFYLIYFRKPVAWFVALFAVATLNRETTLLLLPFFAASEAMETGRFRWQALFSARTLGVLLPLVFYWALWHHIVFSIFAHNVSEYYPRIPFNLRSFVRLRYLPQLASCLGFLGPFLFLGRRLVADRQFRAWVWCLPVWYGFMFTWAILVETRVFGELLPFVTAYTAVLAEEWLAQRMQGAGAGLHGSAPRTALVSRRAA